MGLFDNYRLRRRLEAERLDLEVERLRAEKSIIKQETSRVVRPEDDGKWINISQLAPDGVSTPTADYDHYTMLDQAWRFYHTNPFAKTIIRGLCKFVLGKGPIIQAVSENKIVADAWVDFEKANKWGTREKEMATRAFRDGEVFLRFIEDADSGVLKVRFVRANFIANPRSLALTGQPNISYGIETDPADIEKVVQYFYCDRQGNLKEKIPAEEIMHIKILTDSDMKRGFSFLLTVMPWIKKYEGWLEDRIALNKARTAIALVRTVEGPASAVESIRDEYKSQHQDSDRHKQQALPRATVLTASKGITYSMLSPNINASDVRDDGRSILLAVAAGCGFPEMFLTADYSNANYSSTMVAQNPFVREIEDWQDFFDEPYKALFARVVQHAKKYGKVPAGENEECRVEWPPLILANITQNNQAREIQHRNKIISKKTWQQKEGLDPDVEEANMEEEQGKAIYKEPFNLPQTPTNQYGVSGVPGGGSNKPKGSEEWDDEETYDA